MALLTLLLLGLGGALYALNHLDESPASQRLARRTPAELKRGAYLARAGNCMGCHTAARRCALCRRAGHPDPVRQRLRAPT